MTCIAVAALGDVAIVLSRRARAGETSLRGDVGGRNDEGLPTS